MKFYALTHLENHVLRREMIAAVGQEHRFTAVALAHIAEFDDRRLYLPEGYSSMFQYCVDELRLSEDAAAKRIHAARAARHFPVIFEMLAAGRLSLSAVVFLAPHLGPESSVSLLEAATGKSCAGIRLLLAERFPRPDVPTTIRAIAVPMSSREHATKHAGPSDELQLASPPVASGSEHATWHVPNPTGTIPAAQAFATPLPPAPRAKLAPLAPQRFALQVTLGQGTYDKLRHAQELLGHSLAHGDVDGLLGRALDALIQHLERRKFAACVRNRSRTSKGNGRYVPAEIRRAVYKRDAGRCTFVGDHGHRCESRDRIELDHVISVARGGRTTTENLRLRCRAHNQYEADRVFGAGFMRGRREAGRGTGAAPKASPP